MGFAPGDIVTVRHYSFLNVFKSTILSVEGPVVSLKLTRESSIACFMAGDPIVLGCEDCENIRISGGRIAALDIGGEALHVHLDVLEEDARNRLYERFPVSLYADVRPREIRKKVFALVKDISFYGMLIFSSENLFRTQKLDIDIYLDREIMSQKGEIVRKFEGPLYYEYGLKLLHNGPLRYNHIKNFVKKSQSEHISKFNRE